MRTISALMLVSLLAVSVVPTFAAEPLAIGSYSLAQNILEQTGNALTFQGHLAGGAACETLKITVTLDNTKDPGALTLNKTLSNYSPDFGALVVEHLRAGADISAWSSWYVDSARITCINGGTAVKSSTD